MTFFGDAVDDALAANCTRQGGVWVAGGDATSLAAQNAQSWTTGGAAPADVGVQLPTTVAEATHWPWWAWLLIGAAAVKLLGRQDNR